MVVGGVSLAAALVVREEEQPVALQRTADRAAENVARELGLRPARAVGRPGRRRQLVVAPVVEPVAANRVGAGLDHHVHDGAGDVAELRRIVVRLDADLFHGVGARLVGDAVVDRLVGVDAVDGEVVRLLELAVHERTAAAAQAVERRRIRLSGACGEERDRREVSRLRRQLLDLVAFDLGADHRVLRLEDGAGRDDFEAFLDAPHFQLEVHARRLGCRERDLRLDSLEPLQLGGDHIRANRHAGDDVVPGLVGDAGVGDVGGLVGRGDGQAGHAGARRIRHDTGDRRQARLPCGRRRQEEADERHHSQPQQETTNRTHRDSFSAWSCCPVARTATHDVSGARAPAPAVCGICIRKPATSPTVWGGTAAIPFLSIC